MQHMDEQDLARIKTLLQRAGEFIAYFELAESKMMEWRQEIAAQIKAQQQQIKTLQNELDKLEDILSEAGLAKLRLYAENALARGESYLKAAQENKQEIKELLSNYSQELADLCHQSLKELDHFTKQALERIDSELSAYDVKHFYRVANESCEAVEKSAVDAVQKSRKLLQLFHWKTIALAFGITLITAFTLGLYISNEYPWDMHQQAMNERDAGKLLMEAWPRLSQAERLKIIGKDAN